MSPKLTPKGESSRQQILETAYQIFLEKGYHAATMRAIARHRGITIGGVYTHFNSKEEIFKAVLEQRNPFIIILPAIRDSQGDTVEVLVHDAARRVVNALGIQRETLNLVFIEVVEFQGRHFQDLFRQIFPQLMEIIARITTLEGGLRPEIPLPVLVRSFFGLIISYVMTNIIFSSQLSFDERTFDQFVDVYLYGILPIQTGSMPNRTGREQRSISSPPEVHP